jgi:HK97 family phage prohead protease
MELYRAYAFHELKTEDNGRFSGYASAYGKDLQGDRIAPGAFGQTIADTHGRVPIFYNHVHDEMPLGLSTALAEDGKGLSLAGQLFVNTTDGANAYEMLKVASDIGYRMGMSIGFSALDWDWSDDNAGRILNQIELFEVSLTPWPAQPKAFVADVKTFRDLEKHLREVDGFSKSDAKRIMRTLSDLNLSSGGRLDDANLYSRVEQALSRPLMEG